MYAITGITGQVGSAVARNLLSKNQSVRAVVRDANKGTNWADRGCAVAVADMNDANAISTAQPGKVVCLSTIGAQSNQPTVLITGR